MPRLVTAPDPALRLPPFAESAEQAVLGGLLLDNRGFDRIVDVVTVDDFYAMANRILFAAVSRILNSGRPADALTVADALRASGELDNVGGEPYIIGLVTSTPAAVNVRRYAEIVREKAKLRAVASIASELGEAAMSAGSEADELIACAEQRFLGLQVHGGTEPLPLQADLGALIAYIDDRSTKRGQLSGISTGLTKLDALTSGLEPGQLIIVAARPSMGKTALVLGIADQIAAAGDAVLFCSLEMARREIELRVVAQRAAVSLQAMRSGTVGEDGYSRITASTKQLAKSMLFIDDTAATRPTYIRARARRLKREFGLALIVVDYLQLMRADISTTSRVHEIGSISRALKAIAKELHVPIIACAQLSRALEGRVDRRPMMSDLRDSGEIEQDADIVAMLHREEMYAPEAQQWHGVAELIIRKQRNGPLGTVWLRYSDEAMRFADGQRPNGIAAPGTQHGLRSSGRQGGPHVK
jgi:replicative DNA helicase